MILKNLISRKQSDSLARSIGSRVKKLNVWREQYNPLRKLDLPEALRLIECYTRGEYADLMWTFGAPYMGIECADATLLALIQRRCSPLLEMDWNISRVPFDKKDPAAEKLAARQEAFVRKLMDGIGNLYEAIEHLEMASFRGFSHLEIVEDTSGNVTELRIVEPWNIVRDGMCGAWKYNPSGIQTTFRMLGEDLRIDPHWFVIREVRRPIGRIALVKWIRENLSQKDWDAFVEIYGVPGGIVIMPPDVPDGKRDEYLAAAEKAATGASGCLPNGSQYVPNDGPRGENPFRDHIRHLDEKLVLAGTGSLLTMLSVPQGIGSGSTDAHENTFRSIAKGEAQKISELIQRQFISPRVRRAFPGAPELVWWSLGFREATTAEETLNHNAKLVSAGLRIATSDLEDKTGYKLEPFPAPGGAISALPTATPPASPLLNRAEKTPDPVTARLEALLAGPDSELEPGLKKLLADLPGLAADYIANPETVRAWEDLLAAALFEGLAGGNQKTSQAARQGASGKKDGSA